MKKILVAILITALGLAGALLVYTRGGGGGLGSSETGQVLPVQLKSNAMPDACPIIQAINPLQDQTSKYLSTACIVEFSQSLQATPYCLNKATRWGGANVTIPSQGKYINLPKNCIILVNQENLHSKTVACSGPASSTVKLTVQNTCTPPASNLPEVEPSCPQDYSRKFGDPSCFYSPPENIPYCPRGQRYDSANNCCYGNGDLIPDNLSACPEGYELLIYYENSIPKKEFCSPKARGTFSTDSRSYIIALGSCDEKKSKDTDKPKSCTLDPATGVCQ